LSTHSRTIPRSHRSSRLKTQKLAFWGRRQGILAFFLLIIIVLLGRAIYLQINQADFLQQQGHARHLRILPLPAHRGMLMDRHGEPLAISTPVDSVWVNPTPFLKAQTHWPQLTKLLGIKTSELHKLLAKRLQREFVYIKRHISPSLAKEVNRLKIPGVFLQREYRRYYPAGEVAAHVLGLTNVDDQGQEGLELALNDFLTGIPGAKRIMQDKKGQVVAELEMLRTPRPGQNIRLSLDRRLQYLAYRELKAAVRRYKARAGSAIILNVHTGEVLAMVNQPAYNPNNRNTKYSGRYRNRAVTDVFEPGSTLKPLTIATALESRQYSPGSRIDTRPGRLQIGQYTVRDSRNYGIINLTTLIQKSSNVGASKIALSLSKKQMWAMLTQVGFGSLSGSAYPGEVPGRLAHYRQWHITEQATISFGYGINVTLLQLARAYAALGNKGILPPIRFLPFEQGTGKQVTEHLPRPVMQANTAQHILKMLEKVVKSGGTGSLAQIPGYTVAGKTGTVRKHIKGKYSDKDYIALFAGLVPAKSPRLVMVVMIDRPRGKSYYGGRIAAPVFAKVMTDVLRLLNIAPDKPF
jgi:cell division protein FtsI (penicillin-binding protein 3)